MPNRTPKLCHNKATGRAYVTLNGRRVYLGKWGSPEAGERYAAALAEWQANGRQLPVPTDDLTVVELCAAYWRHAQQHYRHRDGSPTGSLHHVRSALRRVQELYGRTPAKDFGPKALRAVRETWIEDGLARVTCNQMTAIVKRCWKWGAEHEMVDGAVVVNLSMLSGLQKNRSRARETEPVKPVSPEHIEAVRPHVNRVVWDMIQLQRLTACRPGELVNLKRADIDDSGEVWKVDLRDHKTSYRDLSRTIFIGPRAQKILKLYLLRSAEACIFSPREGVAERKPGQVGRRPDQPPTPRQTDRRVGDHYTVDSYRRAVTRACQAAGIPPWTPNQVRHLAATEIRRRYGLEVAQVILGHTRADVTQVYAEVNAERARQVIGEIG